MLNLSIVVITKNNPIELKLTLDSLKKQKNNKNIELIIVNGGRSISYKGLTNLKTKYSTKIISDRKTGIYSAMNEATKIAQGNHLLFLNSGDLLAKNNILKNLSNFNLKKNENYYFLCRIIGKYYTWTIPQKIDLIMNLKRVPVHQAILFSKVFYKKTRYDEDFFVSGDYEIKLIMLERYKVKFIPFLISEHRLGGISSNYTLKNYFLIAYELFKIDIKYKKISNLFFNQLYLFLKLILFFLKNKKLLEKFISKKYTQKSYAIKI